MPNCYVTLTVKFGLCFSNVTYFRYHSILNLASNIEMYSVMKEWCLFATYCGLDINVDITPKRLSEIDCIHGE